MEKLQKKKLDPLSKLLAITLTLIAFTLVSATASAKDRTQFDINSTGTISYVVDGDTAFVEMDDPQAFNDLRGQALRAEKNRQKDLSVSRNYRQRDRSVKVRIANIDTAESVAVNAKLNSQAGRDASAYAKAAFSGRANLRCWEIGYYGRAICSIETSRGDWGEHMIEQGMSPYINKYGRHPYMHRRYENAAQ